MSLSNWFLPGLWCVAIAAAGLQACSAQVAAADVERAVDAQAMIAYLLGCQKPNGAYGPYGHAHSDLAWNYPAVHALVLLGEPIPRLTPVDAAAPATPVATPRPGDAGL